ncbi:Cex1 protein [Maudiozyma humilis]|uniref:Cex1 protein n=1 Tax=Maudiozyma humilis TaxID=51915 RepID=A0AAV5RSG7_MAUHU|nr:Cex1 protein [Kazachstania humilis]
MNFGSLFRGLSNLQLPYSLEAEPYHQTAQWDLYEARSKKNEHLGRKVTVFKPRVGGVADPALVWNCVKSVKRIRVPGLCAVLDVLGADSESAGAIDSILVVTEYVQPVTELRKSLSLDAMCLGLYDLCEALGVLDPQFVIGNLQLSNVFFNETGEWKLWGLECCADRKSATADPYPFEQLVRAAGSRDVPPAAANAVGLGAIVSGAFEQCFHSGSIPREWSRLVKETLGNGRASIAQFTKQLRASSLWKQHKLSGVYAEMKELHIKTPVERIALMAQLYAVMPEGNDNGHFTPGFMERLVAVQLCECITYMLGADIVRYQETVTSELAQLLVLITTPQYSAGAVTDQVRAVLYRAWQLADRRVRYLLLLFLPKLMGQTEPAAHAGLDFSGKIFGAFLQGLADSDVSLRLATLKAVPCTVAALTERQVSNELMRGLARTQVDGEVAVRTATVRVVVRVAPRLETLGERRAAVLATIFTKSLRDPALETRLAALQGLHECLPLFSAAVVAERMMSVVSPGLLDKEARVRRQARRLLGEYLEKLEGAMRELDEADEGNNGSASEHANERLTPGPSDLDEERETDAMIRDFLGSLSLSVPPTPEGTPQPQTQMQMQPEPQTQLSGQSISMAKPPVPAKNISVVKPSSMGFGATSAKQAAGPVAAAEEDDGGWDDFGDGDAWGEAEADAPEPEAAEAEDDAWNDEW